MDTRNWRRGLGILTGIYVSRMLGMFMIFPVFSLYATELQGATPFLIGLALGAYGLTQGLLQIPFGHLSDRFGRKRMMLIGLGLFLLGSVIAALADSIAMMIVGRAVQGMGAISSVALAYATDISPPEKRGFVMAVIGGSIGMAFVLALILGPIVSNWVGGVDGLFWVIAALVVLAICAAWRLPAIGTAHISGEQYAGKKLWQACFAVGILHATFTGTFTVLPSVLVNDGGLERVQHWWLYLPANLIALSFMRYKADPHPLNFGVSFILMAISYALLACGFGFWGLALALTIFFIGFYRLETGLPHWVSQFADADSRGKAMGIFSTVQFLSSFIGAALSGWLLQHSHAYAVFVALLFISALAALVLLWVGKRDTLSR